MAQKKPTAFDWTRFSLKIELNAAPEKVWGAWTDSTQLAQWFPTAAEIEPRKGGKILLRFLHESDILDDTVIAATRPNKLVFPFGTGGQQVEVRIRKHGAGSICELIQSNIPATPKGKVETHLGCRTGWTFFLANLKAWLEHGIDLRSHDPKMSYRQGFINS